MPSQTLDVTWTPTEFFDPAHKAPQMRAVNHRLELFEPIKVMVRDAFKSSKRNLLLQPDLTGCDIRLTAKPRDEASVGYKVLTADVLFGVDAFSNLPSAPLASGPYVVDIFEQAIAKLARTELVETDTIARMVKKFEEDGFRYRWVLKDARLQKRDLRVKLEVSQYPAHDCVWAEITSERLGIFERFEVFSQEKRFDLEPALIPASRGEFTAHGGMYHVRHVSLTSKGLRFGSDDLNCYCATFGRGQLSDGLCDALGIV